MDEEWEVLDIFENLSMAEFTRGILESEGIEVIVRGSTIPYGDSVIFGDGGITELLVRKEQFEKAKEILHELKTNKKLGENTEETEEGGENVEK